MADKVCECGVTFTPNANQKGCNACRFPPPKPRAPRQARPPRVCVVCDKPLTKSRSKFCSGICYRVHRAIYQREYHATYQRPVKQIRPAAGSRKTRLTRALKKHGLL